MITRAWMGRLQRIGCVISARHLINATQTDFLGEALLSYAGPKRPLFYILLYLSESQGPLTGQLFSSEAGGQEARKVMHKASDCTWAPIQTACHGKIFTPRLRHYSHADYALGGWGADSVWEKRSPVHLICPEEEEEEDIVVKWREGGYGGEQGKKRKCNERID